MKFNNLWLIGIHIALGAVSIFEPRVIAVLAGFFGFYALHRIFSYRNRDGFAAIAAAYIVGLEVVHRMSYSPLPWEIGKYGSAFFLLCGLVAEQRKRAIPFFGIIYFLCLLPSILVMDQNIFEIKDEIAFNLSGPFAMAVSITYFYKRQLSKELLSRVFFSFILGGLAVMTIILYRMPSIESIQFTHVASFETSGGFGPNQVSVTLGAVLFLVVTSWLLRFSITGIIVVDRIIGGFALVLGIFTFSRGGMIVPSVVLFLCFILMAFKSKNPKQFIRIVWITGIASVAAGLGYLYINNLTKDALTERYEYANETAEVSEFDENLQIQGINFSGRESIFLADILVFTRNPILGVGPGMAMVARTKVGSVDITAHTEQSRMLSEHGLYGLIALVILIISPFRAFYTAPNLETKVIALAFTLFCFLTLLHIATRVASPVFLYGLGFAHLAFSAPHPLMRKPA
jgi:hypothetical protein